MQRIPIKAKTKTLITGGRGFIGVNLCQTLAQQRSVRVLDNLERSSPTGWSGVDAELLRANILDSDALASACDGISELVHLAAYGSVVESVANPAWNFSVNVEGTFNVLRAAVRGNVRRLIFASTGGALIGNAIPPVDEGSLPKPISPYGASKLCGEAYCHAFTKSYGIDTTCLRFGNVYGPHSAHKRGAVTTFIKALLKDEPIVIYGDGSASRDYIHVEDLCAGIAAALDAPTGGAQVFHLATGRETTILELAKVLCDVAGKANHAIEFRPARIGEVSRNFAGYERAHKALGFNPRWTLKEGLAATWAWFSRQRHDVFAVEATDS